MSEITKETDEYLPVTEDDLREMMEWLAAIRDEMPLYSPKRAQIAATGLTIERLQAEITTLRDSLSKAREQAIEECAAVVKLYGDKCARRAGQHYLDASKTAALDKLEAAIEIEADIRALKGSTPT